MFCACKTEYLIFDVIAGECTVAAEEEGGQQGVECDHGTVLGLAAEAGHPQHQRDLSQSKPRPASGWLHGTLLTPAILPLKASSTAFIRANTPPSETFDT